MFSEKEYRIGAFSGLVAGILIIALTAMAFMALDPSSAQTSVKSFDISSSEPSTVTASKSFDS